MRVRGLMVGLLAGGLGLAASAGCVSMQQHQRLEAANRTLVAEKEHLNQELYDARSVNESFRVRVDALEGELDTKAELLANLRDENEILDEMRRMALGQLENMADKQTLGSISITGPRLPQPLDSALKRFSDQHPSEVSYDSAKGTIKWKADLMFALASDVVKESAMEALRGFGEIISSPAAADFEVIVVGHTDNRPIVRPTTKQKHPTNWHLSAHRAISVANVLRKNGYAAERVGVMGYGEYRPVADNATEQGSTQNRRVEVYLVPTGSIVPKTTGAGWSVSGEALAFARLTR